MKISRDRPIRCAIFDKKVGILIPIRLSGAITLERRAV